MIYRFINTLSILRALTTSICWECKEVKKCKGIYCPYETQLLRRWLSNLVKQRIKTEGMQPQWAGKLPSDPELNSDSCFVYSKLSSCPHLSHQPFHLPRFLSVQTFSFCLSFCLLTCSTAFHSSFCVRLTAKVWEGKRGTKLCTWVSVSAGECFVLQTMWWARGRWRSLLLVSSSWPPSTWSSRTSSPTSRAVFLLPDWVQVFWAY